MRSRHGIWNLPIRLGLFVLFVSGLQPLSAQEDRGRFTFDSLQVGPKGGAWLPEMNLLSGKAAYPSVSQERLFKLPDFSRYTLKESFRLPYHTNPSPMFRGDYSTGGVMHRSSKGAVVASGSQTSLPGLGRMNEASLGYLYAINPRLALQVSVNAVKMNMSHLSRQAFSASGVLTYQASDRVAFNLFGSYDIGNSYGMSTNRYGGSVSVDMSDRFSMEMGVQRYYDALRGGWQTVPVVIPSYRFDNFKLGLDVGGILYEILRSTVFEKRGGDWGGGPTIAPPRFSLPIK